MRPDKPSYDQRKDRKPSPQRPKDDGPTNWIPSAPDRRRKEAKPK